jgi:hypothetical protein
MGAMTRSTSRLLDCALLQCGGDSNKAARNDYALVAGVPPAWKIAADTAASTETLYSRVAFILHYRISLEASQAEKTAIRTAGNYQEFA